MANYRGMANSFRRASRRGNTGGSTPLDTAADAIIALVVENESLQSQLAIANERADGLQKIVDAARAQEPAAWRYEAYNGNYRYRGYVEGFDVDYKWLKPVPLYAAPVPPAAKPWPSRAEQDVARVLRGDIPVSLADAANLEPAAPAVVPEAVWTESLPRGIPEGTRVLVMVTGIGSIDPCWRSVRMGYVSPTEHIWMFDSGEAIEKLGYRALGCTPIVYPPFAILSTTDTEVKNG